MDATPTLFDTVCRTALLSIHLLLLFFEWFPKRSTSFWDACWFLLFHIQFSAWSAEKMENTYSSSPLYADIPLVDIIIKHTVNKERMSRSTFLHWFHVGIHFLSPICKLDGRLCCTYSSHKDYHVPVLFFGWEKCVRQFIVEITVLCTLSC